MAKKLIRELILKNKQGEAYLYQCENTGEFSMEIRCPWDGITSSAALSALIAFFINAKNKFEKRKQ